MQCSLSPGAQLSARASRCTQTGRPRASIRCAAAEISGIAQRLKQEVASLQGTLSATRVNKAKAQAQLGGVAALAEAALAETAATVTVAQAEKKAAAVEAEKKVVQAEKKVAQAEKKVAQAEKKVAQAEKKNLVLEHELQEASANLLISRGKLDARGLFELAEEKLFPEAKGKSRKSRWEDLGAQHPDLQAAILKAVRSWKAEYIPDKACEVYSNLSAQVHANLVLHLDRVALVEGVLNREQMSFLACVADAVHCPYSMHYRQR